MNDRGKISEKFDEYVDDIVDSDGLVSTCDYESFEAGWQAARAQGEPVAWLIYDDNGNPLPPTTSEEIADLSAARSGRDSVPLYTHPPSGANQGGVPEEWRSAVQRAVDELSIIDESEGIAGFHLNGDISPWDEGDLPDVRDELQALLTTSTNKPEREWVRCDERLPEHGQPVRTRGHDGREFDCQFFNWSEDAKPYFKLIGKVFEHDNVVEWKALPPQEQREGE